MYLFGVDVGDATMKIANRSYGVVALKYKVPIVSELINIHIIMLSYIYKHLVIFIIVGRCLATKIFRQIAGYVMSMDDHRVGL